MARRTPKTLRVTRANAGIQVAYQRKMDALIKEMQASVMKWVPAAYRRDEPVMAQDDRRSTPAKQLQREVKKLSRRWQKRFDQAAPEVAEWFAKSVDKRTAAGLKAALKKGGISVDVDPLAASGLTRDVFAATVEQNVGLIRSIPQQYFTEIEGMVMRSVQTGRDLGQLTRDLEARYGVTRRRAALIARDQNNKATSALNNARTLNLGLEEGIWRHSTAGKEPRPKHVRADGVRYKLRDGLPIGDKGQYVHPGEEINCRCYFVAVVPGFHAEAV